MKARKATLIAALLTAGLATTGLSTLAYASSGTNTEYTLVEDKGVKVGDKAPDFTLTDTDGVTHKLSDYTSQGKIVVLEWFNPTCPYVVKHHEVHSTMSDLADKYADRGVVWLAVNSGPRDTAEGSQKAREKWSIDYPILMDGEGDVGKAYGSKNTPTMYVIDKEGVIQYVGAIDNNRDAKTLGDVNYVEQALEAVLAGSNVETAYAKPYGCNVKYPKN